MRWNPPSQWLLVIFLALPGIAQAQFNFTVLGNTVTITGYTGSGGTVTVPTNINGLPVTAIADYAFSNSFYLENIEIPGSIGSVGEAAFANCDSLTNVTIDPGVITNLGDFIFYHCDGLESVTLPNGIPRIGESAFDSTSLDNITIPSSVTYIGTNAFADTLLTNVAIPGNVIIIDSGAFDNCQLLTSLTMGNGVLNIGQAAFAFCNLGDFTIPASVTNIASYAFFNNPTTNVFFEGNAFPVSISPFYGDSCTIYYLPGTSGWSSGTFSGSSTVLWNPTVQTGDGNFGVKGNQFGFDITGTANIPIQIEATSDLANPVWTPLQSLTLTNGSYYFSEPQQAARFYRISSY
ncbi:MAG TPA: leucine-rich repeat domain-containing protein [Verrucomicrobiae bacterium]|jgi:hypothetical protein